MTINEKVGRNLRSVRKLHGLSAVGLSERLESECGVDMSSDALLRYERGERSVGVEDLINLSVALDCSTQTLLDGLDPRMGEVEPKEMRKLSPQDHRILRKLATEWNGDIHALIVADGVYGCLPEEYRKEVILSMMIQMSKALRDGVIDQSDLPDGIKYLEESIGGLI